jgi:hypothetical protein
MHVRRAAQDGGLLCLLELSKPDEYVGHFSRFWKRGVAFL